MLCFKILRIFVLLNVQFKISREIIPNNVVLICLNNYHSKNNMDVNNNEHMKIVLTKLSQESSFIDIVTQKRLLIPYTLHNYHDYPLQPDG